MVHPLGLEPRTHWLWDSPIFDDDHIGELIDIDRAPRFRELVSA